MAAVIKAKITEILEKSRAHVPENNIADDPDENIPEGVEPGDLIELKSLILTASVNDLIQILESSEEIKALFRLLSSSFLKTQDVNAVNDVIEIFSSFLNGLSPDYITTKMIDELLSGLSSDNELIQSLWLKQLDRIVSNSVGLENLINSSKMIIQTIISRLLVLLSKDDNVSNAKYCNLIMSKLAFRQYDMIFNEDTVSKLNHQMAQNDVVKIRILSLMVEISSGSPSLLTKVNEYGFMKQIIDCCLSADPLMVLNCVQLLTDLSSVPHGMNHSSFE